MKHHIAAPSKEKSPAPLKSQTSCFANFKIRKPELNTKKSAQEVSYKTSGEDNIWTEVALLKSDLKVVCKFLFGGGALLFDVQQLPVVVQHDH